MEIKEEIAQCWNESAGNYDSLYGHGLHSEAEKQAWKQMLEKLAGPAPKKILDVGTGTGFLALMLAELGHQVSGIDLSEGMMAQAREKAEKAGLSLELRLGDAENLPEEWTGQFDLVVNRHLLWTLTDPARALTQWNRVLKPGGTVAIIDGNWRQIPLGARIRKFIGNLMIAVTERRNPWRQHSGYTKQLREKLPMSSAKNRPDPRKILEACGFENITFSYLDEIDRVEKAQMPLKVRLTKIYRRHIMTGKKAG